MSAFRPARAKRGVFGQPASHRLICPRLRPVPWRSCRVDCERTRVGGKFTIGRAVANAGMYDHILSLSVLVSGPTQMPKFLRIGVHQSNVSGYTSKAWWVRRVGSTVFLKWGAVEVHGVGDGRKIYWTLPPRAKTIRCGTVKRARDYAKTAIARRRSHRYEPLAGNIAIRRRRANRGAELELALATILFVDIVRSTEKAARLGDSRWTLVMNHYYAAVRRELKTTIIKIWLKPRFRRESSATRKDPAMPPNLPIPIIQATPVARPFVG